MTPDQAGAFLAAMKRVADSAALAIAPLIVACAHFGRTVYALLWYSYIKAGAPYGETRRGLNRWLAEQKTSGC